jgi:uncharacterized protein (DUF488 family)
MRGPSDSLAGEQMTIFTIGHSNHPLERFVALLERHRISLLADIRRFPDSRKHPHFNRERLESSLRTEGIGYEWIEELGDRRSSAHDLESPNQGLRNESFCNYADYISTAAFQTGVEKLFALAEERAVAIMCAEGLWWRCHRRLVSDDLVANGDAVEHVLPDGRTAAHVLTPEARAAAGRVTYPATKTLFDADEVERQARW